MATVSPIFSTVTAPGGDVTRVAWAAMATGDTINALTVSAQAAVVGSVQFTGTFGGATVKLQVSNDGTNFVDMKDLTGASVTATAAGYFEFTTAGLYLRPTISGGTGDAVTATLVLRG
jgi:hypothetical protein